MTITPELKQAIEQAGEQPLRIEDPVTHAAYVILREETYERLRSVAEAEKIDPSFYEYGEFIPVDREAD
jgi:hypothetical protein